MISYVLITLLFTLAAPCLAITTETQPSKIFFKNPLIHKLDAPKFGGATVGIDGPTIHDVLWLIKEMKVMVQGAADNHSPIVKKYEFQGKNYTLGELVKVEQTLTATQRQAFGETLVVARKDFEEKTQVFMFQIRLLKSLVCDLIEEWCVTCNKTDSFLRVWGNLKENEFEYFHKHITSARQMVQFMGDLKDFLTKLIQSCPNAWEEFLVHQKTYAAHQSTHKKHDAPTNA